MPTDRIGQIRPEEDGGLLFFKGSTLKTIFDSLKMQMPLAGTGGITVTETEDGRIISGGCVERDIPIPSPPPPNTPDPIGDVIGPIEVDIPGDIINMNIVGASWEILGASGYSFGSGPIVSNRFSGMPAYFVYYYAYDWPFHIHVSC
jgi:hypothetical protein